MRLATFRGGIHPYEGKELTMDKPMRELLPGKELIYPMAQHIGAPAKPIVAVGDKVLAGQRLGEAQGYISAHVLSSVSGTVTKIEPRLLPGGTKVLSVVVENDGEYRALEGIGEKRDYRKLSKQEIRDIVKEAGIVGMGGAAFPTHVKLTPKDDKAIQTIIVNGAECEPYLTSDYRVMMETPELIIEGLKVVLTLFENARGVLAVENNKPEAVKKLTELVKGEDRISVCPLKTKYPQGGERFLIYAVTGKKINSSMLPADAGCIVSNVDTFVSVRNAVCESRPLMRRVITVSGDAVKEPCNLVVKTGTIYQELLDAAGGFTVEPKKLIAGGPMMGKAIFTTDIPVTKNSSALLALSRDEAAEFEPSACIRCGRCVSVCPGHIVPQALYDAAINGDKERFVALSGMECCECGCCTYTCPAKRHMTQAFAQMKAEVNGDRKKNQGGK